MSTRKTTKRAPIYGARVIKRVPDRVIGAYFALFPLAVAAFLGLQAVRAHSAEAAAHPTTVVATGR